jgi:ATP-binding cassette subfamily C (CFTR/MRP) protein 1
MIRREFSDCTVLTIAHRLETILDFDLVVVMDDGTVGEMGQPGDLLQNEGSKFSCLVKRLGMESKPNTVIP